MILVEFEYKYIIILDKKNFFILLVYFSKKILKKIIIKCLIKKLL